MIVMQVEKRFIPSCPPQPCTNTLPEDKDMQSERMLYEDGTDTKPSCPPPPSYAQAMQGYNKEYKSGGLYTQFINELESLSQEEHQIAMEQRKEEDDDREHIIQRVIATLPKNDITDNQKAIANELYKLPDIKPSIVEKNTQDQQSSNNTVNQGIESLNVYNNTVTIKLYPFFDSSAETSTSSSCILDSSGGDNKKVRELDFITKNIQNHTQSNYSEKDLGLIYFRTYGKAFLIFTASFAIADLIARAGRRNPLVVYASSIAASLFYLFGYTAHTVFLRKSVEQNKKHSGVSSTNSALVMPFVMGAMIAPVYFRFSAKEVFAAMMATSCIFAVSALYGYKAEEDFGKYQHIIGIAVTSILLVSIANRLIGSGIAEMCISAAFICLHAFFIANSAQEIKKLSEKTTGYNISQLENFKAMDISNSLVGVTLDLLNIKAQCDR